MTYYSKLLAIIWHHYFERRLSHYSGLKKVPFLLNNINIIEYLMRKMGIFGNTFLANSFFYCNLSQWVLVTRFNKLALLLILKLASKPASNSKLL